MLVTAPCARAKGGGTERKREREKGPVAGPRGLVPAPSSWACKHLHGTDDSSIEEAEEEDAAEEEAAGVEAPNEPAEEAAEVAAEVAEEEAE